MRNIPEATERALRSVTWGGLIGAILGFGGGFTAGAWTLGGAAWGIPALFGGLLLGSVAAIGGALAGAAFGLILWLRGSR